MTDDRLVPLPLGLATSIGSVPHVDPSEAVDFVLRHQRRFPAAPSLPARSRREGMIALAVERLNAAGVGIDDIAMRRPTLDDVFLKLTGHAAEDPEAEEG